MILTDEVRKWKGRVIGSEEEIKYGLDKLGRSPIDYSELEEIIF